MRRIITKKEPILLPLEKVRKNSLNSFTRDHFDDLKSSINMYGLITPISVIGPDDAGYYILIAGEQRTDVFRELLAEGNEEFKEIPAYVLGDSDMSETEQQLLIEASNLDMRDATDKPAHYFQVVKLIKELAKEQGLNKREIIAMRKEYMKTSDRYARFYEQVFDSGNVELQRMVEDGELSVSRAGRIAKFSKENQKAAIEDLKAGGNQDAVVNKYKKNKNTKNKQLNDDIPDSELGLFDDFGTSEIETQEHFTDDDIPDIDLNDDELDDFDFNSFDTSSLDSGSFSKSEKKENTLNIVLKWCETIKKKDTLTDEEWQVIEACKKVVEKFY